MNLNLLPNAWVTSIRMDVFVFHVESEYIHSKFECHTIIALMAFYVLVPGITFGNSPRRRLRTLNIWKANLQNSIPTDGIYLTQTMAMRKRDADCNFKLK